MSYPYYIVDAFAEEVFKGNPAAVYVLEKWLPEAVMQNIAIENNLSETAFTVKEGQSYACVGLRRNEKSICAGMLH